MMGEGSHGVLFLVFFGTGLTCDNVSTNGRGGGVNMTMVSKLSKDKLEVVLKDMCRSERSTFISISKNQPLNNTH